MPRTAHPITASAHCGTYGCGHIAKSSDRYVKRAGILHQRRLAGHRFSTTGEDQRTLAALALMRQGRPCIEVRNYADPGALSARNVPVTPATADPMGLSDECVEVMTLVAQGYSHPEVAAMTHRATETVRSLVAVARRATAAHTQEGAVVALYGLGIIED
jgi:DNA-binding NarL/FixJ family response regulator